MKNPIAAPMTSKNSFKQEKQALQTFLKSNYRHAKFECNSLNTVTFNEGQGHRTRYGHVTFSQTIFTAKSMGIA